VVNVVVAFRSRPGGADKNPMDDPAVHDRLRVARIGAWFTVACALLYAAYFSMTWSAQTRGPLLALSGLVVAASLVLAFVPLRALMRRPLARELFFLTWTLSSIAVVTVAALLDGGADSPLFVGFFLPLIFAALSYPVTSVLVAGVAAVLAYVTVAASVGGAPASDVFFVAMTLSCGAWMCTWQARSHARQQRELARVSRADPLTGCLNRRGFEERVAAELARTQRTDEPFGLVLLDLDDFKQVNDRDGHAAGDDHLRWVATTTAATLRAVDVLGRLGGDECAVLVPGADRDGTRAVAHRMATVLAARAPASMGLAVFPDDGDDAEALHRVADSELYVAKRRRGAPETRAGEPLHPAAVSAR
jgi:diguanylate cyclase (GGDEF)-like protein